MSLVTASVIAWNDREHLRRCLTSLRAQRGARVHVVVTDNASADGSAAMVRREFPEAQILSPGLNLGYAGAHNGAFASSDDPYFLVLNADVRVNPDYVAHLVSAMEEDPELGAVSGKLLREGADAAGAVAIVDSVGIVRDGRGRFRDLGAGLPDDGHVLFGEVFGVCGAAALYRRAAILDSVPDIPGAGRPFDAAFFAYYEDADLAWALRRRGWRARIVADATARHVRGGSGADPALVEQLLHRNAFWALVKHARIGDLARVAPGWLFYEAAKFAQSLTYKPFLWRVQWERLNGLPAMWRRRWALERNAQRPRVAPRSPVMWVTDEICRPCAKDETFTKGNKSAAEV